MILLLLSIIGEGCLSLSTTQIQGLLEFPGLSSQSSWHAQHLFVVRTQSFVPKNKQNRPEHLSCDPQGPQDSCFLGVPDNIGVRCNQNNEPLPHAPKFLLPFSTDLMFQFSVHALLRMDYARATNVAVGAI